MRAFEVNALDYLLKPINPQRLAQALTRLTANQATGQPEPKSTPKPLRYDDAIVINTNKRVAMIKLSSIVQISVSGDYTEIYTAEGEQRPVLRSLREWQEILPAEHFFRIHRTILINLNYLQSLLPADKSRFQVYMKNISEPLYTSRHYASELKKRLR